MNPEEVMRALVGSPTGIPSLTNADKVATDMAQKHPFELIRRDYKINPQAFTAWENSGPWSTNVDDRRDAGARLEDQHMVEILKSLGASDVMLNKYKNQR